MENLVSLIDDHTEYFRSHLAGFAKTERRVYLSVIDLWQPSSTGRNRGPRPQWTSEPYRPSSGGWSIEVRSSWKERGKKRLYAAAERLYSIYYKLRPGT